MLPENSNSVMNNTNPVRSDNRQYINNNHKTVVDKPNFLLNLICFFNPFIGLVVWLCMKNGCQKRRGKLAGFSALMGFIVCLISIAIFTIAFYDTAEQFKQELDSNPLFSSISSIFDGDSKDRVESEPLYIFDNEYIEVSYLKRENVVYMDGMFNLYLSVKNISNKTIGVRLENISLNGVMISDSLSGAQSITASNVSNQPFMLSWKDAGLSSLNDVNRIQFDVIVFDSETYETLSTHKECAINSNVKSE